MKSIYALLLISLFLALSVSTVHAFSFASLFEQTIRYKQAKTEQSATDPIYSLGFVGDIMMGRSVEMKAHALHGGEFRPFFIHLEEQLRDYDILFGNLEGPVSDKGKDQGSLYSFRMDPLSLETLSVIGFDILSVANNHAFDWGEDAFRDTLDRIQTNNMHPIGGGKNIEDAFTPHIQTLPDGTTLAYLAFSKFGQGWMEASDETAGIAIINEDFIASALSLLKDDIDIIIVSYHFGEEYETLPSTYQDKIAKLTIDAGADLVVGHHTHVVQPLEKYNDGYIAYGLGNFIFDQGFSTETMTGGILNVEIENKRILSAFIENSYQNPDYQVHLFNP